MIFGMCGKAGSGKDTVGDYLIETYNCEKLALADPIKRLVKDVFALDDHTVYDRVAREEPLEQWGNWSVRKLLQFVGTELFRRNIDEAIWVKSLWYKVRDELAIKNYVISDIRFPNELNFFEGKAGTDFASIKVVRDGKDGVVGLKGHESEAYDLDTTYLVENNGTFEELYNKVDFIASDLGVSKVKEKHEEPIA